MFVVGKFYKINFHNYSLKVKWYTEFTFTIQVRNMKIKEFIFAIRLQTSNLSTFYFASLDLLYV